MDSFKMLSLSGLSKESTQCSFSKCTHSLEGGKLRAVCRALLAKVPDRTLLTPHAILAVTKQRLRSWLTTSGGYHSKPAVSEVSSCVAGGPNTMHLILYHLHFFRDYCYFEAESHSVLKDGLVPTMHPRLNLPALASLVLAF